jgi:hypothetical protein
MFTDNPDLSMAALLLDSGVPISDEDKRIIFELARDAMHSIVESARAGTYSAGAVDVGLVLAGLAVEHGLAMAWEPLLEFIGDPAVATTNKERAIGYLVARRGSLPQDVSMQLRDQARSITSPQVPLMSQPIDVVAMRLRIAFAFGGISTEDAIAALIVLATGNTDAKQAVADLLRIDGLVPSDTAATIALTLARDSDASVVASAASALPKLARSAPKAMREVIASRLAELMGEDGALIPRSVVTALADDRSEPWPITVEDALERLSADHLDLGVREAARRALGGNPGSHGAGS